MPSRTRRLRLFLVASALTVVALLPGTPVFADRVTLPPPVSPNGSDIEFLYNLISIPAIIIFLGVEAAILFVIIRYRRKSPLPAPPQWHGNTLVEIVWTLIPLVIVLVIAGLSIFYLQKDFAKPTDAETQMDISIIGYRFNWDYQYPQGFKSTGTLVVPTGKMIRLNTNTTDVIHSWWVPNITGKTDAVPGYQNFTWMKIERPGKWHGECAELCGTGHYQMLIDVEAKDPSDFDTWVAQQMAKLHSPSPSSSASAARTSSPAASPSTAASGSPSATPSR